MGFGRSYSYNAEGLPTIVNYEAAVKLFEKREPYKKGGFVGKRPLGSKRRYTRSLIDKDDERGVVACSYYGTEVVVFHKDGRIECKTGGYPSLSTLAFLQHILKAHPRSFMRKHGRIYCTCPIDTKEFLCLPRDKDSALTLHPDGRVTGAQQEYTHKLNTPVMREYRKKYKLFTDYAHDILTMNQIVHEPTNEVLKKLTCDVQQLRYENSRQGQFVRVQAWRELFDLLDAAMDEPDTTKQLEQFYMLVNAIGFSHRYRQYGHTTLDWDYACTSDMFKQSFTKYLKLQYADTMFTKIPADISKPVFDGNSFYAQYGNNSTKAI